MWWLLIGLLFLKAKASASAAAVTGAGNSSAAGGPTLLTPVASIGDLLQVPPSAPASPTPAPSTIAQTDVGTADFFSGGTAKPGTPQPVTIPGVQYLGPPVQRDNQLDQL